jgi:hypothetical protein
MVRWWVRLHARGTPPRTEDVAAAAREVLAAPVTPPEPVASTPEAEAPAAPPRVDSLMEID